MPFDHLAIIVQARMESQRFPGKILAPLLGQPLILWALDRLSRVHAPHTLLVAMPDTGSQAYEAQRVIQRHGYECMLVSAVNPEDVLGRFALAAQEVEATEIVRVCGDSPLVDPGVVDDLVSYHRWQSRDADYTGVAAGWPDGTDVEIFTRNALERANDEATDAADREHVTPYLWKPAHGFTTAHMPCPFDLSWMQYSVDTEQDVRLVSALLSMLLERYGHNFTWRDIWSCVLASPWVEQQMRQRVRNSGYLTQVDGAQSWIEVRYGT